MPVGITRSDRIASFVLEKAIDYISNEIARNDGILAVLASRQRIKLVSGSDLFEERVEYQENSNSAWRSKFAQIDTNQQSNWLTAKYGQATNDGAVVINSIEQAQNKGSYAISDMTKAMIENAIHTISRDIADALRAASPASTEPESILTLISKNAFGTQTGTFGGINRATYSTFWQNQYNNTAANLAANAGLQTLMNFYWQSLAKGSSLFDQPNFGLCSGTLFASLAAYHESLKQFRQDEDLAKMGISSIKVLNMSVIVDPAIDTTDFYMFNTNYLQLQVLRMEGMEEYEDTPEGLPIAWGPLQLDIDSANKVKLYFLTCNLTCNSLQRQGVMDNCT